MGIVPDIQACDIGRELRSCLMDMRAKDLLCGAKDHVGRRVVTHKRPPAVLINDAFHSVAALQGVLTNLVENNVFRFDDLVNTDHRRLRHKHAGIRGLSSSFGIEQGCIQHNIVVEDIQDRCIKLHIGRPFIVALACLRDL